jgi:phage terminase large subunit
VPPFHVFKGNDDLTRLYIPASVYDNKALMERDPKYIQRLEAMSDETQKEQLLHGNWNIAAGAFFSEFTRRDHVREPFDFMNHKGVKLYRSIDYGLDMLACLWYAELPPSSVNPHGKVFIYRELCEKDLTISEAARKIREATPPGENIICTYAPADVMNNRDRVSGRNQGDIFAQNGLSLVKSNNDRKAGWIAVKELFKIRDGGEPILEIFSNCTNIIKHLPMLEHDDKCYGDVRKEPHIITHAPDSLRYYAIQWHTDHPIKEIENGEKRVEYPPDMLVDYRRSNPAGRAEIERMMGGKPKLR